MSITVIYHGMSLTTVSVSLWRVICLSQWFIMVCLWLYCISITMKSDMSITVIYHGMSLTVLYQYHYEEWYVYHSDLSWYVSDYCISITMKSDMSITVIYHGMSLTVLYQYHYEEWYVYHSDLSWYVSDCTVSVSLWRVICLSQWFIMVCLWLLYQYHYEEWYVYHSDLSWYVSDCTVSVSLWRVICLSQWFIMVCLWLYCISITMKSDMSITVIYHGMSLTVLYQYHYEEWYVYHSDLSWYVSDCTVSVSLWRVICLSQWFIMVCLWLYCISITMKSDMSITVIYHGMSLTVLYQYHYEEWYVYHSDLSWYVSDCTVSVSLWRVICLSQWFIMVCLWLYCISITMKSDMSITVIYHGMSLTVLYQYHYEEWYVYHSDLSWYVSDCTVAQWNNSPQVNMLIHIILILYQLVFALIP